MALFNSALTALVVCACLTVGVVISAVLTPRLTGRIHGDPRVDELELYATPDAPAGQAPGGDLACRPARDAPVLPHRATVPEVLAQLMPAEDLSAKVRTRARLRRVGDDPPPADGSSHAGPATPKATTPNPEPPAAKTGDPAPAEPRRIRVRTSNGRTVIARVHGSSPGRTHVVLPDGQLGIPDALAFTSEPFCPATAEAIAAELREGPFTGFPVKYTAHYLILYQSSEEFADESGKLLENLYKSLSNAFRKNDIAVHEAEFPLVAVIFRTEADFRAHKRVDPAVQAYYETYTNRIYFYQTSLADEQSPEIAAVRRPQTVAHEGTHQILQNIGIQPRLASWPPWLEEGVAEYCATPVTTKRGTTWNGLGAVNAQHLATIRDLDDPLSGQVPGTIRPEHIGRPPGMPMVEYLVTKSELSPTDYALSWAMTHYLVTRRFDEFVDYLKAMSRMPPLEPRTPSDHLAAFHASFGSNLAKLDREIGVYLTKLKVTDHLPYYSVVFQQRMPGGMINRAAIVSQSPSMIRQWLDTVSSPAGDTPVWEAVPYPNRTRAYVAAQEFVHGQ